MEIMKKAAAFLLNRNVIFLLALVLAVTLPGGVRYTRPVMLVFLGVVMTVSMLGIGSELWQKPARAVGYAALGLGASYLVLGGLTIALTAMFIDSPDFRIGFFLIAAAPPAVATMPFTDIFRGNRTLTLTAILAGYAAAFITLPLMSIVVSGESLIDTKRLLLLVAGLIVAPFLISRVIRGTGLNRPLEAYRGPITNWSFFVVMYTIVAVNRDVFLEHAGALVPVVLVSVAVTFALGLLTYYITVKVGAGHEDGVSVTLLSTLKNYALAGGIALTFLSDTSALPAAVQTGVMIPFVIWLDRFFQKYHPDTKKVLDKS
jgi:BASS family bile acid:Na+ symporter